MSENRSHEEYHDPDYRQFQPSRLQPDVNDDNRTKTAATDATTQNLQIKTPESQREAICRVIEREFQRELTNKEQELHEINKRIDEAKQLLAKVRYVVVHNYYNRKNLLYSEEEIAAVQKSQQESMTSHPPTGDKPQMPIHPSLKKLLGKRPIDYDEILKSRPPRKAAKNATEQFQKLVKKPIETKIKLKESIRAEDNQPEIECKKPRYIGPSTSMVEYGRLNSARGRNNYRHLLVIGNVSKYIGDEEAGSSTSITHKWVIYITSKTAVPVEQIVSRARFFLHESYKPNDVIEVNAPPFQITKRGWGEFPVRIQLYFHEHLMQKPVQIFHTIILDKKHSGLQTMGAETIVELWLNMPNTEDGRDDDGNSSESNKFRTKDGVHAIQNVSTPPEPMPSTSAQITSGVVSNHQISNFPNEVRIKQETVPMEVPYATCDKPTNDRIQPNHPSIVTPQQQAKIEQTPISQQVIAAPSKQVPASLVQNQAMATAPKANTPKRFIKCVSKDGRVSLMELVQDESNPKLFKMILPKGGTTSKVNLQQQLPEQHSQVMNAVKLMKPLTTASIQPLKVGTVLASTSSGKVPIIQNLSGDVTANLNLTKISSLSTKPISNLSANSPNIIQIGTNLLLNNSKTAASLPKLVDVNSPKSTIPNVVPRPAQPNPTPQPMMIPKSQQYASSPPGVRIIKKDNKILVLDPKQLQKTQRHPQSLLKPQVSLLKPRPTTSMGNAVKKITIRNIPGIEHKNINVFVPNDIAIATKSVFKAKNACTGRQDFNEQLEKRFIAQKLFTNMTDAIAWLMKAIPLVSANAGQPEFRESFPFVVPTMADFYNLHVAKQRSFEWLRAKHINRLVAKHPTLRDFRKWTTKEIVLYGRWFSYTPKSVFNLKTPSIKTENCENVRDIVKSEIMREHLQNDIISFNTNLKNWLAKVEANEMKCLNQTISEQIISIDIENDEELDQRDISPKKVTNDCMQLPIVQGSNEVQWINEVCRKMQIRFDQEEIVDGILHRSAEHVFATALRSFVEDLLRKCCGSKLQAINSDSVTNTEINNDDVLRTISTIQRFDFLTNKHLGIDKASST